MDKLLDKRTYKCSICKKKYEPKMKPLDFENDARIAGIVVLSEGENTVGGWSWVAPKFIEMCDDCSYYVVGKIQREILGNEGKKM